MKEELSDLTNNDYTLKTVEAFKSHPILKWIPDTQELIFKYDLFDEHFKNLYLGLLLNSKIELCNKLIHVLAAFNNYNSSFQDNLVKRISTFNDDKKLQILSIIDGIKNYKLDELDVTREIKNRALSSIFIFVIKSFSNNIIKNTELLREFFESKGYINGFCLINCNIINSPKVIFDFSNLRLISCIFQNYEYFGDCSFNDKTIFESCKFEKLSLNPKKSYSFKPHNFKHPDGDDNFKDSLRSKGIESGNTKKDILEDVKNFLSIFYTRGDVYTFKPEHFRKKYKPKVVPLSDMMRYFDEEGICFSYVNPQKEIRYGIDKDCRDILIQFVVNGKNSMKIEAVIKKLLKNYK